MSGPSPALPARGPGRQGASWAGRPHAPGAAALFAFKSPSWGRGGGDRHGSWRGPFVLGVTRPGCWSLCPAWEACGGGMSPVGLAGRGARSPGGEAPQTLAAPRLPGSPRAPSPGLASRPPGAAWPRPAPRPRPARGRRPPRPLAERGRRWSLRPPHFLPPLGTKGRQRAPRPAAAASGGAGPAAAFVCAGGGERAGPRPAAPVPAAPFCPAPPRGPVQNQAWGGGSPSRAKPCFQRLLSKTLESVRPGVGEGSLFIFLNNFLWSRGMGEGLPPPAAPPLQGDSLVLWGEGGSGLRGN